MEQLRPVYEFGPFQIDSASRLLSRDGRPVELTPKALDLLMILVRRSALEGGRVIGKDELM